MSKNTNNILARALIEYIACKDNVKSLCLKHGISRSSFYRYKQKVSKMYNIDFDTKHDEINELLKDLVKSLLVVLKHIDTLAKSNNAILDYAGKELLLIVSDITNKVVSSKNHNKLGNSIKTLENISKLQDDNISDREVANECNTSRNDVIVAF